MRTFYAWYKYTNFQKYFMIIIKKSHPKYSFQDLAIVCAARWSVSQWSSQLFFLFMRVNKLIGNLLQTNTNIPIQFHPLTWPFCVHSDLYTVQLYVQWLRILFVYFKICTECKWYLRPNTLRWTTQKQISVLPYQFFLNNDWAEYCIN